MPRAREESGSKSGGLRAEGLFVDGRLGMHTPVVVGSESEVKMYRQGYFLCNEASRNNISFYPNIEVCCVNPTQYFIIV